MALTSLSKVLCSSLLLTPLLSVVFLLSAAVVNPCEFAVQASHTRSTGTDGRDGRDGQPGRAGRAGRDQVIWASDTPAYVDLQGGDGGDGGDGERASRPRCDRYHNEPAHDLEAPDGGDGGNGGAGGAGGAGGNLTVYYESLTQLRNIYVNAAGGDGGRGGRGAAGTRGCYCEEHYWSVATCTDGSCTTTNHDCTDGDDGDDGDDGAEGEAGALGRVRVIKQSEPLTTDNPEFNQAISSLTDTPVALSRNLWEVQTGAATGIFASGSIVDDTYERYSGRVEQQFQLVWSAARSQQSLSPSSTLTVRINPQGTLEINPTEDLWIDAATTTDGSSTTYQVNGAVLASEATQLSLGRHSGRGDQLNLNILDLAGTSDLIETRFFIRYKTNEGDRRPRYVTRYEAELPIDLIEQEYNRFSLSVGQLPINAQYLTRGTDARVELVISRSYAGNTAEQTLDWNGRL